MKMEENVALDSQKQKKFVKSIKGIKKLIQKSKDELKEDGDNETQEGKPFSMRLKGDRVKKSRRKPKGLVYLGHIPHGFYEHQMTQYFKQFGVVTNARVIRSKRTGNSKGYAFVEFKEPSVAQIVAETMNNYLMGKRLIKAEYIPPEKQRRAFRKRWNALNNPTRDRRLQCNKIHNRDRNDKEELKRARKILNNFNKLKKKLSDMGINYDFFTPVDIPEQLLDQEVNKEKPEENVDSKKNKKEKKVPKTEKDIGKQKIVVDENQKVSNKVKQVTENQTTATTKTVKKEKGPVIVNKKEQKQKMKQLKAAGGVKTLEEFIKVDEGSEDSDSSDGFDSDEYEKALELDDEGDELSSGESGESDEEEDDDEDEEEDESDDEEPPKPVKAKVQPAQKRSQQNIRNVAQRSGGSPKKPKFEKQNQKPMKKQFKKK